MTIAFYITAAIAILATLLVITGRHAVHALLYLVVSLFAVAVLFYLMGAPFAAALEVIVYAGAIMVLFVFVIMMLNVGRDALMVEGGWKNIGGWLGPALLCLVLLVQWLWILGQGSDAGIAGNRVPAAAVGGALFGPYLLAVEMAGLILLVALVGAFRLGGKEEKA
ncbi:NADH-quinone oxidoreductase subunit J [Marinobacteraceae bacterium S3BR75-40.1]